MDFIFLPWFAVQCLLVIGPVCSRALRVNRDIWDSTANCLCSRFFFGFSLSYESFKTKATDVRPATSKIGDVGR